MFDFRSGGGGRGWGGGDERKKVCLNFVLDIERIRNPWEIFD